MAATSDLDALMDTLAGVLRDYGKYAFDLEKQEARRTQLHFEAWAQHVVIGSAPPGATTPPARKDYAGLRQSFVAHRKAEQSEVVQSQDALRDVVWAFVAGLNRVVTEDEKDQTEMQSTLSSLASSLQHANAADVRKLAQDAVGRVEAMLARRRDWQKQQVEQLASRLEHLGSQLEVARRESTVDALTQVYNRRAFDEHLVRTADLSSLKSGGAALVMLDIDFFKKVNDEHGHPAGDAVLQSVASTCVRHFKRKGDFVARYGGEEFAVILRDVGPREAFQMADKLRETVARLEVHHGTATLRVTVSMGVALLEAREAAEAWVARADAALYRAKHGGRNRVED